MSDVFRLGTGWLPDDPDPRDHTPRHENVLATLGESPLARFLKSKRKLPAKVDLRTWCPPVQFQGGFNTCTSHVVATLVEYFQRKVYGKNFEASRLFLYKVTKNLLQKEGNVGVYIRQTMGALKLLGVPPERYWPYLDPGAFGAPNYTDPRLDVEPTPFCYALALDYKAMTYYRLDTGAPLTDATSGGEPLLRAVKLHLSSQIPLAFGFPLYPSLSQATTTGRIPYPTESEQQLGNHAVVAVGYDDTLEVANTNPGGGRSVGALAILNSWSAEWGEQGFGWLPYDFILKRRARDFWTLLKAEWIDLAPFELPL
ncbi:MAG TPA: C1 family peptidase [Thermoanaerobaculia bacterium]|nr:C1 family peptidase [Thermoanaerobaculia bacterium]